MPLTDNHFLEECHCGKKHDSRKNEKQCDSCGAKLIWMDGILHTNNDDCDDICKDPECKGKVHYQAVYGGYEKRCGHCGKDNT